MKFFGAVRRVIGGDRDHGVVTGISKGIILPLRDRA